MFKNVLNLVMVIMSFMLLVVISKVGMFFLILYLFFCNISMLGTIIVGEIAFRIKLKDRF